MKRNVFSKGIVTLTLAIALIVVSGNVMAQRGMGMGPGRMSENWDGPRMGQCNLPNVTPEQQTKINELRTKHLNEVTPIKNQMNEKRARLQTLQSSSKVDLNEINKTIDEIAQLKASLMKKNAAHRAEIASLLTDEQKAIFNSRQGKMGKKGKHAGRGFGGEW